MRRARLPRLPGLESLAGVAAQVAPKPGLRLRRRRSRLPAARDLPAPAGPSPATVVLAGAAAPFASTSYGRARLLRQMHACGLLTEHETEQARQLFGVPH
jgi:hypothetical protein